LDKDQIIFEFKEATEKARLILFRTYCRDSDLFPKLFLDVWHEYPDFLKRYIRGLKPPEVGPFLLAASGSIASPVVKDGKPEPIVSFSGEELNDLFSGLPKTKKKAAIRFFKKLEQ
jgi:hypothetical protein